MNRRLPHLAKTLLLQSPLLTPIAVGLDKPAETALAIRTANLFSFRQQGLPFLIRPLSYQGKEGVWMAVIAFHIGGAHKAFLEGAVYLNPRDAYDLQLLQHLMTQDRFPILFLSPGLRVIISHAAEWTVHHRQELRLMLAQMTHGRGSGVLADGGADPDFERVRQEFDKLYAIENLLRFQPEGTARVSSSFRGAVLD